MTSARRTALFVAIVCTAAALAGGYLLRALQRPAIAQAPGLSAASIAVSRPPPSAPFFLFRWTRQGPSYGVLAYTNADRTAPPVPISNLQCQRVHMAGGRGVCLAARGGTAFRARLFDDSFKVFAELPLPGVPSRTQVSPDGKLAATTVFVSGHSYTDAGFSTQTGIVDLTRGAWLVENLESFTVHRRQAIVRSIDFNFWGVTFMHDGRTFVATLGTKAERLLVRGNVDSRQVEVIEENVECPSLSPDNRRVAFKQRAGGAGPSIAWEIWVLDLESRKRYRLAETHSVDDQLQWLGDTRVLYARPSEADPASTDQWSVAADGSGQPSRYLADAYSGTMVVPAGGVQQSGN